MNVTQALINECIKQKRKAQYELYKECYAFMMKICLRYQRNDEDAQSLVNQAFLKISDNLEKFDFNGPFEIWVRRITINTCIDEYRKQKRHKEHIDYTDFDQSVLNTSEVSFNAGAQELDADALRALLRQLPETTQKVFNLCVLDGYNYEEASEQLGVGETTCRWHVHNARKLLKEMIERTYSESKSMVS